MKHLSYTLPAIATLTAFPSFAETPNVLSDIAPVHSLVQQIMGDVATPTLLLSGVIDPHHVSLRPSQAASIANADLVFWIGEDLSPWLEETLHALAPEATSIELLSVKGTHTIEFDGDNHDDHEEHDDHDDHDEEKHDDHADHEEHGDHDDHQEHAHGSGIDPHAWLDLANMQVWTTKIATELAAADPANAETYTANADALYAELAQAETDAKIAFGSLKDVALVSEHAAYGYIVEEYELNHLGGLTDHDGHSNGPAELKEIRTAAQDASHVCVLTQPGSDLRLVKSVFSDMSYKTVTLDQMMQSDDNFATAYTNMAQSVAGCLTK